jgi:ATP-dependent Clp protease ATP-binding subunit ClpB
MNLNKFTEKAQESVITAQNLATELTHSEITPEHLLVALVEQDSGIVPSILRKMTLDPAHVAAGGAEAARQPAEAVWRRRAILAAYEPDFRVGAGRSEAAAG